MTQNEARLTTITALPPHSLLSYPTTVLMMPHLVFPFMLIDLPCLAASFLFRMTFCPECWYHCLLELGSYRRTSRASVTLDILCLRGRYIYLIPIFMSPYPFPSYIYPPDYLSYIWLPACLLHHISTPLLYVVTVHLG